MEDNFTVCIVTDHDDLDVFLADPAVLRHVERLLHAERTIEHGGSVGGCFAERE